MVTFNPALPPTRVAGDLGHIADTNNIVTALNTLNGGKPDTASTINPNVVDTKGDLIVGTASDTVSRLGVGTNDHVLVADSSQATGLKWALGTPQPINAQTGASYAPMASDAYKLVTLDNTIAITVTLPQDSTTTFAVGARIDFLVLNTGMATFAAGSGATVNATPSAVTRARYSAVTAIKRAANTWVLVGDLASP